MADHEVMKILELIAQQQAAIGNEVIRCLQAIETNQKERKLDELMGEEPEEEAEPIKEVKSKQRFQFKEPVRPAQEKRMPQVQEEAFDEVEDAQELTPEEYRELEAKTKRVL